MAIRGRAENDAGLVPTDAAGRDRVVVSVIIATPSFDSRLVFRIIEPGRMVLPSSQLYKCGVIIIKHDVVRWYGTVVCIAGQVGSNPLTNHTHILIGVARSARASRVVEPPLSQEITLQHVAAAEPIPHIE